MKPDRQKWTIRDSEDNFVGTIETSPNASRDTALAIAYHRWPTIVYQYQAVRV